MKFILENLLAIHPRVAVNSFDSFTAELFNRDHSLLYLQFGFLPLTKYRRASAVLAFHSHDLVFIDDKQIYCVIEGEMVQMSANLA